MDRLASSEWRRGHSLGRPVAPDQVYAAFEDYGEALQVTGHAPLAEALQARVTPQLCADYAGVLYVLKRLARPPGYELPVFPKELTWEEILMEEPLEGEEWEEVQYSEESEWSEDLQEEREQQHEQQHEPQHEPQHELQQEKQSWQPQVSVPSHDLQVPPLSTLDQSNLAIELIRALLGYTPHCPNVSLALQREFSRLQQIVTALRQFTNHREAGSYFLDAFLELQSVLLALRPPSVLAALAAAKPLVLEYKFVLGLSTSYNLLLDQLYGLPCFDAVSEPLRRHLDLWLNEGRLGPILSSIEPNLDNVVNDSLDFELPAFVNRQSCVDAGRFAWLSLHLGHAPQPVDVSFCNLDLAATAELRLGELLQHLRPVLLDAWHLLTQMYFAHDARVLEFLQNWSQTGLNAALLQTSLEFDREVNPKLDLPPLAALVLPVEELRQFWRRLLEAYGSDPAQLLEMQLFAMDATRSVRTRIDNLRSINKIVLGNK